jgi:group I intron endonuclease
MDNIDLHSDARTKMIVYCVTNTVNGKKYVGKTRSSLTKRIKGHLYDSLVKNSQYAFHAAIRKYGPASFTVSVLAKCCSLKEIREKEIDFITDLNTCGVNGYNMTKGGEGTLGFKHTEETKCIISKLKKGVPMSDSFKAKLNRQVCQVDPSTENILAIFQSIGEAETLTGSSNVGMCASGKISLAGGFVWRYLDTRDQARGRWSDEAIEKMKKRLSTNNPLDRAVNQIDLLTGNVLSTFPSVKAAHEATGATNISGVCRGIRHKSGGFSWCYLNDSSY